MGVGRQRTAPRRKDNRHMSDQDSPTPSADRRAKVPPAINWQALEQATHVDLAGRNLLRLGTGGRPWDAGNLAAAAGSIAQRGRRVIIVTGFCRSSPPGMTAETDGPPGALFLARAAATLGIDPVLVSDRYGLPLLEAGCDHFGLARSAIHEMPIEEPAADDSLPLSDRWCEAFFSGPARDATHLVAIERPGPVTPLLRSPRKFDLGQCRPHVSSAKSRRPIATAITTCAASESIRTLPRPSNCLPGSNNRRTDHHHRHRRRRQRMGMGCDRRGKS